MISIRQNHLTIRRNHRMIDGTRRCILIVAQQIELRARIARVLQSVGYAVELAESRQRALELARGGRIEAAIVVPSADLAGLSQELRDKIPRTIILAHRREEIIPRDYSLREANPVSAQTLDEQKLLDQLGRSPAWPVGGGSETALAPVLKIKDCKVDLSGHTFVTANGREVHLTRAETALLAGFVSNPCRVLSRDQLRRAVVGHGAQPYDRNIDMLISRVRRKIESDPKSPQLILTVPGVGYKFAARPHSGESDDSPPALGLERSTRSTWFSQRGVDGVNATSAPSQAASPHLQSVRQPGTVEDLQRELAELKIELAALHRVRELGVNNF